MKKTMNVALRVLAFLALTGAIAGFPVAATAAGSIYACVNNSSGTIHIVGASVSCASNEILLVWNTVGPQGPQGAAGKDGTNGIDGKDGVLGSYDQLAGLPCTTAGGTPATVQLVGLTKSPICAGISANGRFLDYGLVVFDAQTNLMWEKKDQTGGLHDVGNLYTWCEANGCAGNPTSWIDQVNSERFAGFSNWRVPTKDELLAIVDTSVAGCNNNVLCIDPIFSPATATVWSSTLIGNNANAIYVGFQLGGYALSASTSVKFHVRAVRTGP